MVFLVSTAYATSVTQEPDLVKDTAVRLTRNAISTQGKNSGEFHTIVAVVDKLPAPTTSTCSINAFREEPEDEGWEGLSYAFLDGTEDTNALNVPSNGPASGSSAQYSTPSPATMTFNFSKGYGTVWSDSAITCAYSVQVPLANTVFRNGLPSTLQYTIYAQDGTSGDVVKTISRRLKHHSVTLPIVPAGQYHPTTGTPTVVSAPIVPLTAARPVAASMGNILRRLAVSTDLESGDTSVPASQELEAAVQSYFKARQIPPQTVSVWALIIPKKQMQDITEADNSEPGRTAGSWVEFSSNLLNMGIDDLEQAWKGKPLVGLNGSLSILGKLLVRGCKLCKVLSGGGGWGKKAGLLSLDPDIDYNTNKDTNAFTDRTMPSFFEDEAQVRSSALGDIFRPGDYVQFFIRPTDFDEDPVSDAQVPTDSIEIWIRNSKRRNVVSFGVVPSTIDAMPALEKENGRDVQVHHCADHFGALSETGIALTLNRHKGRSGPVERLTATRLNVPFGRFVVKETKERLKLRMKGQLGGLSHFSQTRPLSSPCRYGFSSSIDHDRYYCRSVAPDNHWSARGYATFSNKKGSATSTSTDRLDRSSDGVTVSKPSSKFRLRQRNPPGANGKTGIEKQASGKLIRKHLATDRDAIENSAKVKAMENYERSRRHGARPSAATNSEDSSRPASESDDVPSIGEKSMQTATDVDSEQQSETPTIRKFAAQGFRKTVPLSMPPVPRSVPIRRFPTSSLNVVKFLSGQPVQHTQTTTLPDTHTADTPRHVRQEIFRRKKSDATFRKHSAKGITHTKVVPPSLPSLRRSIPRNVLGTPTPQLIHETTQHPVPYVGFQGRAETTARIRRVAPSTSPERTIPSQEEEQKNGALLRRRTKNQNEVSIRRVTAGESAASSLRQIRIRRSEVRQLRENAREKSRQATQELFEAEQQKAKNIAAMNAVKEGRVKIDEKDQRLEDSVRALLKGF